MKSNRTITICIIFLVSFTLISSLFTLLTTDVQALNVLSVNVSGDIITNTTWTKANSPYILTDEITVNEGVTLTIEPGVMVMGQLDTRLAINGRLEAIGTSTEPITFTSVLSATPGEWDGIHIVENGSAHLNHTVVQYAYSNINIHLFDNEAISRIENSKIEFSEDESMQIMADSLHLVELNNVTFAKNGKNRIIIYYENDDFYPPSFIDNTTLTPQPGLEGYEVYFSSDNHSGDFIIPTGITLTLEPGVTFFMPEDSDIRVDGRLEAIGTPSQPITFTSIFNSFAMPWGGLFVFEDSSVHLNNTVIQYAYYNIGFYLHRSNRTSIIENTHIQYGGNVGMQIASHSLHLVELDNVTFKENGKNRIEIGVNYHSASLLGNATLTHQPGLEGYEFYPYNSGELTFTIPANISLTVEPNVTLYMEKGEFVVNGRLQAIGTPSQPITFTSITTETNQWDGVVVDGGNTELTHATIQHSQENGLAILAGSVTVRCSAMSDNLGSGITVAPTAQGTVLLEYNSLVSNTVAGLSNEGSGWIDARYNWWGAADGPSGIGPGSGDAVTGNVAYTPWLAAPDCQDKTPKKFVFLPIVINQN